MMYKKNFAQDESGTSAVEFALIAPAFLSMFFGIVHMGLFFFGSHQAQQATEAAARAVRLIDRPDQDEISVILQEKLRPALAGNYSPNVEIVQQFGGDYAEIEVNYTYVLPIPFLDRFEFTTLASSTVLLRDL